MVYPEPCKEFRRQISAAIYGWDCPLLAITRTGFEDVAQLGQQENPPETMFFVCFVGGCFRGGGGCSGPPAPRSGSTRPAPAPGADVSRSLLARPKNDVASRKGGVWWSLVEFGGKLVGCIRDVHSGHLKTQKKKHGAFPRHPKDRWKGGASRRTPLGGPKKWMRRRIDQSRAI